MDKQGEGKETQVKVINYLKKGTTYCPYVTRKQNYQRKKTQNKKLQNKMQICHSTSTEMSVNANRLAHAEKRYGSDWVWG